MSGPLQLHVSLFCVAPGSIEHCNQCFDDKDLLDSEVGTETSSEFVGASFGSISFFWDAFSSPDLLEDPPPFLVFGGMALVNLARSFPTDGANCKCQK